MKTDLTELQSYLKNKNICLLGNAKSILNNKKDIESYDIVCRMNRGISQGKEEYIGKRTDVLFISTTFREDLKASFNATNVVWMTECQKLATDWIKENAYQNPPKEWRDLKVITGKNLPSTGLITINFLLKHIAFKSLTIYGFDFFKSGTWYHNIMVQPKGWHMGDVEEILIKDWIKSFPNVKLVNEHE